MARVTTQGKCQVCGRMMSKGGMTRHLATCLEQAPAEKGRKRRLYRLVVEGRHCPEYWMHLEMPAKATLDDLDFFLRRTWLECCGHLSCFTIGGVRFASNPDTEWGLEEERSMNIALERVLRPGDGALHEYDYGTTTELIVRVVGEREGVHTGSEPRVLARNEPPAIACERCGQPATQVCTQCIWDGGGWLCDACLEEHDCGDEMALPVVNSPRVGMCGYTG
jgi:hypothetical protein